MKQAPKAIRDYHLQQSPNRILKQLEKMISLGKISRCGLCLSNVSRKWRPLAGILLGQVVVPTMAQVSYQHLLEKTEENAKKSQ